MTVTVYKSTDSSAPVHSNAAGGLLTLLDAILVNGYGTGPGAKAAQGWTIDYTGTNLRSYRAATGNRMTLGVDDTGANNSRLRGFESMTAAGVAIASGTGPFPTDTQMNGGNYFFKGFATGKTWLAVGNGKLIHLFIRDSSNSWMGFSFGEFRSLVPGDNYNTILLAENGANSSGSGYTGIQGINTGSSNQHYPRPHGQVGTSVESGKSVWGPNSGVALGGSNQLVYPSPGGLLYLCPVALNEGSTGLIRGTLPGIWSPQYSPGLIGAAELDTVSGTGNLAGRTFIYVKVGSTANISGVMVETSDTWDV